MRRPTTGTVRLAAFYGARARRLLPAAVTVLVATCVASAVLLPPLQARSVIGDGIASALYVGNYRFAIQGTDYLAADAPPSPLQHYWSLGVEEQFYLLWPALIIGTAWLLARVARRTGVGASRSVAPYVLVLAVLAAVSFTVSLAWTDSWPSWAFFSLPTRAWELAVGGLVASDGRRVAASAAARRRRSSGWGGLALIVVTCTQIGEATPYPGHDGVVAGARHGVGDRRWLCDTGFGCRARPVEAGDAGDRSAVVLVVPVALAGAAARPGVVRRSRSGWRAGWRWWWCRSALRS